MVPLRVRVRVRVTDIRHSWPHTTYTGVLPVLPTPHTRAPCPPPPHHIHHTTCTGPRPYPVAAAAVHPFGVRVAASGIGLVAAASPMCGGVGSWG